ncbi:hypothetical protein GGX14DRAFT_651368 [Mycena pura]|uniref:ABC transporter domain-containing protein n=1 Tax=Mycena pura TaxID=153505 RepID=A0AAD7E335_9AGAR|nr:hypothetical protein GGX14DRAFT_651368 [Mycena pura]
MPELRLHVEDLSPTSEEQSRIMRIVELSTGKIEIDGYDINTIGLDARRRNIALVPQDNIVLFLGTLRQNIDPHKTKTDAELICLLQRAWLLPREGIKDPVAEAKFSLDTSVGDDGANFSAREKQPIRENLPDNFILICAKLSWGPNHFAILRNFEDR